MRNIKDIKNTLSSIETSSRRNDEKFNKWNQTMSVLMQDLKNKIAKARHIADGVSFDSFFFSRFINTWLEKKAFSGSTHKYPNNFHHTLFVEI